MSSVLVYEAKFNFCLFDPAEAIKIQEIVCPLEPEYKLKF